MSSVSLRVVIIRRLNESGSKEARCGRGGGDAEVGGVTAAASVAFGAKAAKGEVGDWATMGEAVRSLVGEDGFGAGLLGLSGSDFGDRTG